jgi:hypothetical protein
VTSKDPVDGQTYREIAEIRDEVSRQGGLLRTLVYSQSQELSSAILSAFASDDVLTRAFLELETPKTQGQVVEALKAAGVQGASQPTVSRKMEKLDKELGVIAPISSAQGGTLFVHSESAAALRLIPAMKRHASLKKYF